MATIGKVSAVFTASTSGLTSGVNQAASSMKRLEASTASLSSGMRSLVAIQGAQLFGSIVSGASSAVSSLVRMGQAEAGVIDQTSKLAARLGMTYGELSGLALAGDLAGVSMETIGNAATKADVAFVRAAEGSTTALAAFNGLGLSLENLNGLSSADRFNAIADAIAKLPTEAQRAEAAVQLFGRAGAQLLPLFAQGAASISSARAEAERFGLALTNAQGKNVEDMNDSFTRVQAAISGIVQQVTASLAPAITAIATQFTDFVGSVGGANIGQAIGDGILQGARFLAGIGDYIIQNVPKVWEYLSQVGVQWNAVWEFGQRVADVFVGVWNAFEAAGNLVGGILANAIAGIFRGASKLASLVPGFDSWAKGLGASADTWAATVDEYNKALVKNINESANAFSAAFGDKSAQTGQAIAGPLVQSLDAAIAKAADASRQIDVASREPVEVRQTVVLDNVKQAVQGIDARSTEGVREMFRLMRGEGGNVQQQQLQAQLRIAAAVEAQADGAGGMDLVEADIAM